MVEVGVMSGKMVPAGPCVQAYPHSLKRGELIECEKTTRHWKHKGHDHWIGEDGKVKTGTLQWWGGELDETETALAEALRASGRREVRTIDI